MRSTVIEPGDPLAKSDKFHRLLREHGIEPNDCYRVEVEADEMTAYCYKRTDSGAVAYDHEAEEVETKPPVTFTLPSVSAVLLRK